MSLEVKAAIWACVQVEELPDGITSGCATPWDVFEVAKAGAAAIVGAPVGPYAAADGAGCPSDKVVAEAGLFAVDAVEYDDAMPCVRRYLVACCFAASWLVGDTEERKSAPLTASSFPRFFPVPTHVETPKIVGPCDRPEPAVALPERAKSKLT
jgi:hypothetical protein